MGSTISSINMVASENVAETLDKFNRKSKSGVGVHVFCFTKNNKNNAGKDKDVIYIGSEVSDENGILDVKYTEWKKEYAASSEPTHTGPAQNNTTQNGFFAKKESKLKEVWTPIHTFSSGRVAMIAVAHLLSEGYEMTRCQPVHF